jgi:putative chitinase
MATQYTPEEIAEIFEAYNNAIKTGTPISADLAKQMQDASKGVKGASDALNKFGKSLGTTAADLGKSLYKGEKGVGQFGDAVEMAANAIQAAILAIPGIGIAAKIATTAMVALAKGVNAAAKQGDALYKSYQDLSKAGATASDGISGVFRNMQNLGYGIEELDKMVALVSQNSETLAKFSMTAADGTNAFAQGMAQIQRDGGLRLLGKTTDDINGAGAAFIRQQVTMGRTQKDVGDSLGAKTKQYILDLDRLQKLTGTSADALQKQQEALLSEDAYNVYMESLEQQGEAGLMQKKKIEEVTARLPQYEKLIAQAIGGNVEAQQQLFFIAPELIKDLRDPVKSTADTLKTFNVQATNAKEQFKGLAGIGGGTQDVIGSMADLNKAIVATSDVDARNAAAAKNTVVTDKATQALTAAQIANMDSRDAMQAFIQKGVAPATTALAGLAKAASGITGAAAEAVGAPGMGAATGGKGIQTYEQRAIEKHGKPPAAGAVDNELLNKLTKTGITGKREQANILAQVQAESGGVAKSENLNYSPEQLLKTFPKYIKNIEDAQQLVQQGPEAVGNRVYGGRMGNQADEGFTYRGRGLIQLTGKDNYAKYGKLLGIDLVKNPDLANDPGIAKDIAAAYFAEKQKTGTDLSNIAAIGKAVGYVDIGGQETKKRAQMASQIESQLPQARNGGTLTGPSSGYAAMLHGTEAVVPLPNGKTIPVEMAGFSSSLTDQTGLMSRQLDKLDELVRVMQSQVSVSTKILQAAN